MTAFQFTSRDFSTIRADLLARASAVFPEWTDRDPSDFGMVLLDLWAHSADVMNYYIDRAAGEAFLPTATQRESVLALANLLDYVPRGRTAAQSVVTLQNTTGTAVLIPAYTSFVAVSNSTSYPCFSTAAASVPAMGSTGVLVSEGTRYVEEVLTTSSSGVTGQTYTLSRTKVDAGSLLVYVYEDGVSQTVYQRVSTIVNAGTGDRAYATYTAADGTIQIVFGTALNGFIPPSGSKITATYAVCSGASGNLPGNTITSFSGAAPTGITITANTVFSGGLDEETIASMKNSIPSAISAQNRAVTRADYIALALQLPGVAKASLSFLPGLAAASAGGASVGTNASVTIYPQTARSDYLTTASTSQAVPASVQTSVTTTLQPLATLGVTVVSATTINWQPIDIIASVVVTSRFVQTWVQQAVSTALDQLFTFDNVFFGQVLHLGQIYQIINNVPGVEYATITRFDLTGNTGVQAVITIDPLKIPKKGTYTLNMSGGTTTF